MGRVWKRWSSAHSVVGVRRRWLATACTAGLAAAAIPVGAAGAALGMAAPAGAVAPAGAAGNSGAAAGHARAGSTTVLTVYGALGRLPAAPATVLVEVQSPLSVDARGVPHLLVDSVLVTSTTDSPSFRVAVPASARLDRALASGHGVANLVVLVLAGGEVTSEFVPFRLSSGGTGRGSRVAPALHIGAFPAFSPGRGATAGGRAGPRDLTGCRWSEVGSPAEASTRVGEVHVANMRGVTMRFVYSYQADSTFSVGLSLNGGVTWGADGSVTITNSISGSGGFTEPTGTTTGYLGYANDHMYYAKYVNNGAASCPGLQYITQVVSSTGDAYVGPGQPGANPWGTCHADPSGFVTVQGPGGWFDADRGTAVSLSGVATVFGFAFGGHTGFTGNIYDDYTDNNASDTYLCGAGEMPDVPVIYNSTD